MKTQRKGLGNSIRFKIFTRDGFICQYCGQHPPEVVLEVDHIVPVAKGGQNEIDNLITACRNCNQGKKARLLTDKVPKGVSRNVDELKERYDQMVAFYKHQQKIGQLKKDQLESIADYWTDLWDGNLLSTAEKASISHFLMYSTAEEVMDAMSMSRGKINHPFPGFKYMCGILHKKRKERNGQ